MGEDCAECYGAFISDSLQQNEWKSLIFIESWWFSAAGGCILSYFFFLHFSKIVEKIDADEDGFVTEAELKAWIKKAQKKYIYDNVERQWKDFDMNNDGMISWDEYKNVTYGTYLGKNVFFFINKLKGLVAR